MESADPVFIGVKKKVLILSSKGGYGHMAASLAIQEIFRQKYDFVEMYPIEAQNRLGSYFGENLYNNLVQNGWIRTMNFLSRRLAPLLFRWRRKVLESLVKEKIEQECPDLVLSLIPFINYPAAEAAMKCHIPYLLVTTDNDLAHWTLGLEKVRHPEFKVTIGRDHSLTAGILKKRGVPKECIETIGLPVHPIFLEEGNSDSIRKTFTVPEGKPVVTIMMGGAGGKVAFEYAKKLRELNFPLHVVICTGNNKALYEKMHSLLDSIGSVSFSILSFTDRIADLMQISDLLITKPGPGTINEAMLRRLPILVDDTHSSLVWERVNLDFVVETGLGQIVHSPDEVKVRVPEYLHDLKIKRRVADFYKNRQMPCFADHIVRIVDSFLDPSYK